MNWGIILAVIAMIVLVVKNMDLVQTGIKSITSPEDSEPISTENLAQNVLDTVKQNIMIPIWLLILIVGLILVVK